LNEDQQRLIDYVYFKGYSMKAFAEIEGVSPVAITYRHKEILKKLKEIF
jgi:DNA-directed RNA polymerase specialized sigma subunit